MSRDQQSRAAITGGIILGLWLIGMMIMIGKIWGV